MEQKKQRYVAITRLCQVFPALHGSRGSGVINLAEWKVAVAGVWPLGLNSFLWVFSSDLSKALQYCRDERIRWFRVPKSNVFGLPCFFI